MAVSNRVVGLDNDNPSRRHRGTGQSTGVLECVCVQSIYLSCLIQTRLGDCGSWFSSAYRNGLLPSPSSNPPQSHAMSCRQTRCCINRSSAFVSSAFVRHAIIRADMSAVDIHRYTRIRFWSITCIYIALVVSTDRQSIKSLLWF